MFIFLMYNNYYAMKVVRTQVAQSNKNLVSMYMNQIDSSFEEINNYIYNFVAQDEDSDLVSLSHNDSNNPEHFLSRVRVQNKFNKSIISFKNANMFFVYSVRDQDLLSTAFLGGDFDKLQSISNVLKSYIMDHEQEGFDHKRWKLVGRGNEMGIVKFVTTESNLIVGAWVDVNKLIIPLNYLDLGQQGQALIVTSEGVPLTKLSIEEMNKPGFRLTLPDEHQLYSTLSMGLNYLLVDTKSQHGEFHLDVLIPENTLLQRLPYFQRLIFIIPLMALMILGFYLVFLQNILLKPMAKLITGMRRIKQGELETRLSNDKSREFMLINETFNEMVNQIQGLKINVYEEQIRTQKAELKHLQVQINPHFLLNSINIIYNLAELKKNDLIKQMSTHLAQYFRFITRTNLTIVKVSQEMKHIESYLEIQKLRFPKYLSYETWVEPGLEDIAILPLIIQPFVENAVLHGFEMGEEIFYIRVSVSRSKEQPDRLYEVQISDNGKGIEAGKLLELQKEDLQSDYGESHLGIWNVRHRLNLYYGQVSQLTFEPGHPNGMVIRLLIPIQAGGESHV
jgi:two-component system sensor histidine kinase YesM